MINAEIQGGNIALTDLESDRHYPASNTAATKTIAAVATARHVLTKLVWSYSGAPTGGRLTVVDGATTVFDIDISAAGPGSIGLMAPMSLNSAMAVTLAAGGVGITGKLQFYYLTKQS